MKRRASRRSLLKLAGAVVGGTAVAGTVSGVHPQHNQIKDSGPTSELTFVVKTVGLQFIPEVLTVPAGTTVQWIGNAFEHTVTSSATMEDALGGNHNKCPARSSESCSNVFDEPLDRFKTVEYTFEEPGHYPYFCRPHYPVGMVGRIVVE